MDTEFGCRKTEKLGRNEMSTICWKEEITIIAGPFTPKDNRESWLAIAARRSGVGLRTIKGMFYGEIKDPRFSTAERIRGAANQARKAAIQQAKLYEQIAASLAHKDEDFHGNDIAALIDAARTIRGLDRTGNNGGE